MSKSKGGLGRGLAALIPTGPATDTVSRIFMDSPVAPPEKPTVVDKPAPEDTAPEKPVETKVETEVETKVEKPDTAADEHGPNYREVPIGSVRPNSKNPRTVFDEEALAELEHSLREFGLLQPIVVRPVEDGYELIMGERRWRAAQQAGFTTIGAIVRRTEDADMLRDALLENIHRANLNPLEEAAAYQQLLQEFAVTQEELAARLGRSRPVISNTIRLLKLPVVVQRRVAAGVLSAGHARALLSLESADAQEELAARIVAEGLSVRGTEEAVVLMAGAKPKAKRPVPRKLIAPGLNSLAEKLADTFDTRVKVELGRKKGQVVIEFATVDDLNRIISLMAPQVMPTKPKV